MNSLDQFEAAVIELHVSAGVEKSYALTYLEKDSLGYTSIATKAGWWTWQASRACATPEWEHAPDWANWLAMDSDGQWWWFAVQPEQRLAQWWNPWGTQARDAGLTPGRGNWTETLEPRP